MTAEQVTTIITSVLQGGGLLVLFYYYIRGLKTKISGLEGTIRAQDQTLSVMDKRIAETEKIGSIYRNLISDLPKDLENYKAVISQTKDSVILELQNMNKEKDVEIARLREAEKQLDKLPRAEVEKRHSVRAIIFLHQNIHEEFAKFVTAVEKNEEHAVSQLIRAKSLPELVELLGGTLQVETNPETFKTIWKGPDGKAAPDLRHMTWSVTGSFAVFVGRRVVMDPKKYAHFDSSIKRMREYIET